MTINNFKDIYYIYKMEEQTKTCTPCNLQGFDNCHNTILFTVPNNLTGYSFLTTVGGLALVGLHTLVKGGLKLLKGENSA